MSPLRLFSVFLIGVTSLLFAGSLYLRHDLAHAGTTLQRLERVSVATLTSAGTVYRFGASRIASLQQLLKTTHGEFNSGVDLISGSLLTIKAVEFSGNYFLDAPLLLHASHLDTQPGVFGLSLQDRVAGLIRHPWIEDAEISWQILPNRLHITIKEAEPWIVAEYSGHSWLLSRDKKLLSPLALLPNSRLIEVTSTKGRIDGLADRPGPENYLSSENARLEYATRMVALLEMANAFTYAIDRYTLLGDGSLVVSPQPPSELPNIRLNVHSLSEAETVAQQIKSVLEDLAQRQERVSETDLRFQPQVIVR